MIPDPGRAALIRYLSLCIRRRLRAERLLARRRELEREAEAQLRAWDADRRADHLTEVADRLDELLDTRRRHAEARQSRIDTLLERKRAA